MSQVQDAVRMRGIEKSFGPVHALRGADFSLAPGEVHALLGENGAGKTTLMQVLFGLVRADAGSIEVHGRALASGSPRGAMAAGLGMVHQHFSLVPRMTVAENVALGRSGVRYNRRDAEALVRRVGEQTGLALDPSALASELPAGSRQRLEIVKALARDVRVLILDEPTAALALPEVDELFAALRRLVTSGMSVVLITHKLREVLAIADRVTVLRRGEVVCTAPAKDLTAAAMARAMIGEDAATDHIARALDTPAAPAATPGIPVLEARNVRVRGPGGRPDAVRDVSFDIRAGEIVGIAAVEGNGQRELMRAAAGLMPYAGTLTVRAGGVVGFVPEDRQSEGLILDFSLTDNLALGTGGAFWLDRAALARGAAVAIGAFDIQTSGVALPVRTLSGGNQQKVVLARVLGERPSLLVAESPTSGLDIRATAFVHARIRRAAREDGLGVLFYSTDLDEVLALADRVAVMVTGTWRWVPDDARSRAEVGAMMLEGGS